MIVIGSGVVPVCLIIAVIALIIVGVYKRKKQTGSYVTVSFIILLYIFMLDKARNVIALVNYYTLCHLCTIILFRHNYYYYDNIMPKVLVARNMCLIIFLHSISVTIKHIAIYNHFNVFYTMVNSIQFLLLCQEQNGRKPGRPSRTYMTKCDSWPWHHFYKGVYY